MSNAWRNDGMAKVTGRAKYADDLKFVGMLHAVPVYSDFVHARIVSIETEDARRSDGVRCVLTAKDAPGSCRYGQIMRDYRMLADDKIRYHGDVVAVVVAETRAQAIQAAERVRVVAEELPAIFDPREAMKDGAILIHEEHGGNVVNHHKVRRGDMARGWAESDAVIEREFQTQFVEHAYMEPESAVCVPRPDGVIEVYGSMQHPFSTRRFTAALLGVPLADVEVKTIPMGGGFGGKDDTAATVCARAALAAKITGRPVKMTYAREWSIRESYKRHPYIVRCKWGVAKDGLIRAAEIHVIADAGAYCSVTPFVTWRSTVQCCGPYDVPNVQADVFGVYTNNVWTGAMRGFGSPQMNFVVEQMAEIAAAEIGLSAVEFRRRNMVRQGSVTITGQRLDEHVVSLPQVFDRLLAETQYEEKLKTCSFGRGEGNFYGIGLALSYRGMSLGGEGMDFNGAIINVQFDGSILLEVGVHENGQGAESAMMLLLARELGVSLSRLRYRQPSTSNIPDGGTTVASRATLMGGGAVVNAARNLKRKMAELLCDQLRCTANEVRFENDELLGKEGARLSFAEAVHQLYLMQEYPFAFGSFKAPRVTWDEETGQGNAYFTWVYGGQCVELNVRRASGKIQLLHAWAAHDVGRAVNREMLLGQYYGGMAMGTGYGMLEEVRLYQGKIQTLNFNQYRIARATDMPEMTGIIIENPDPLSPSGAKGIGEPANELMAPAIANAVYHATGVRHLQLPIRIGGRA